MNKESVAKAFSRVLYSHPHTKLLEQACRESGDVRWFPVGGAIRDTALFSSPRGDIDIALECSPEKKNEIRERMIDALAKEQRLASEQFDFTAVSSVESYVKEFDVTVNALYFDPKREDIVDPSGSALRDLEQKVLKPLSPAKLITSARKPIRFFRFLAELPLTADSETLTLLGKFNTVYFSVTSSEYAEAFLDVLKLLSTESVVEALELMHYLGHLEHYFPELHPSLASGALPSPISRLTLLDKAVATSSTKDILSQRKAFVATIKSSAGTSKIRSSYNAHAFLRLAVLFQDAVGAVLSLPGASSSALPESELKAEQSMFTNLRSRYQSCAEIATYLSHLERFLQAERSMRQSEDSLYLPDMVQRFVSNFEAN